MTQVETIADDLVVSLPLPLAQLYRRAQTSVRGEDRHLHAYYLGEATLKLAASLRIGIVLQAGLEPESPLARRLEKLCMPMLGEWVGFLRESTSYLRQRPDTDLLPLAGCHEELLAHRALPAVTAFAQAVTGEADGEHLPLQPQFVRENLQQGVMGFFTILTSYRNRVIGHGSPKLRGYYERVGPLLMEAVCEVLRLPCLFGNLTMAVCRLQPNPDGKQIVHEWRKLTNLASLMFSGGELDVDFAVPGSGIIEPGQVYFVAPRVRVPLHPLVVYYEDQNDRERVGFLNDTTVRKSTGEAGNEDLVVRRCEFLDYATGDHLRGVDVQRELSQLLKRLRGRAVSDTEVAELTSPGQPLRGKLSDSVPAGVTVGDFQLLGELGRGAMGIVYRASQRSLDRVVALKVVPPMLAADPVFLSRFAREIAALARCEHPNLVKIITSGTDRDRHFYAMELVEGADLSALYRFLRQTDSEASSPDAALELAAAVAATQSKASQATTPDRQSGKPAESAPMEPMGSPPVSGNVGSAPQAEMASIERDLDAGGAASTSAAARQTPRGHARQWAALFAAAADGLAHLHARGIIHRDLKPGNLMLTQNAERLVIMDLGLAQVQDRTQGLTQASTRWLGTLRYCSPEQLRWNMLDIDERADIYGFGATLYEIMTLHPLFDGDSESRLIEQILHQQPREPRHILKALDRDLNEIIMHCLEKDRGQRYPSARAVADDLRRYCQGLPVSVRPLSKVQKLSRWTKNNPRMAALTMLVASLLWIVSIGASTGVVILSRLLTQTREAQQQAQSQSKRAQAAELERAALEVREDASDFAMVREQIRADRFDEAHRTLQDALRRATASSRLQNRLPDWNRLRNVVQFYRGVDTTWNYWGEEDYARVLSEAGKSLALVGALETSHWWESLPSQDLSRDEQKRLATEAYRLLMIYSAVHTVGGSVLLERLADAPAGDVSAARTQAVAILQRALPPLRQAQSWELSELKMKSTASEIMENLNRDLLVELGEASEQVFFPQAKSAFSESDYYFLGLMYFVTVRAESGKNPICETTARASDGPIPPDDGPTAVVTQGLLSRRLLQALSRYTISKGESPLETSELLLRTAAGTERRFWPCFALGRTLFFEGHYAEAELAFGTCIAVRPQYARGYEQRALMRALEGRQVAASHSERGKQLQQLARLDSNRALALAGEANDPATFWSRADLHYVLDEPATAIKFYLRAVLEEPDVHQKVNRRNNLSCAVRLAKQLLADQSAATDARNDARELLETLASRQQTTSP